MKNLGKGIILPLPEKKPKRSQRWTIPEISTPVLFITFTSLLSSLSSFVGNPERSLPSSFSE